MVRIYYHGTLTNPLVKLRGSQTSIKIQAGIPFDVTEIDWAYLSTTGEFSKFEVTGTIPGAVPSETASTPDNHPAEPGKTKKKKRTKKEDK